MADIFNENQRLRNQNTMMRKLGTNDGFFKSYFEQLPYHNTQNQTFEYLNNLYFDFFGEYKYNSWQSFRNCLGRYLNNK